MKKNTVLRKGYLHTPPKTSLFKVVHNYYRWGLLAHRRVRDSHLEQSSLRNFDQFDSWQSHLHPLLWPDFPVESLPNLEDMKKRPKFKLPFRVSRHNPVRLQSATGSPDYSGWNCVFEATVVMEWRVMHRRTDRNDCKQLEIWIVQCSLESVVYLEVCVRLTCRSRWN